MATRSTWLILLGVVLLFLPIPPFLSALAGVGVIIAGVVLRFAGDDD
jgi:hypothetical protein